MNNNTLYATNQAVEIKKERTESKHNHEDSLEENSNGHICLTNIAMHFAHND